MDYLDDELEYKKSEDAEVLVKDYSRVYRKIFIGVVLGEGARSAIQMLIAKNEPVRKIQITKRLYKYWLPVAIGTFVIYPIDKYSWKFVNEKTKAFQELVFD